MSLITQEIESVRVLLDIQSELSIIKSITRTQGSKVDCLHETRRSLAGLSIIPPVHDAHRQPEPIIQAQTGFEERITSHH